MKKTIIPGCPGPASPHFSQGSVAGRRRVLLIFVDGLGLGPKNPDVNPLAGFEPRVLGQFQNHQSALPSGGSFFPTAVNLEVPGLPQSATGQTALFTGVNAARLVGRHLQGFPTKRLRELLAIRSIFKQIADRGGRPTFANAFTPPFFKRRPRWVSATTVMCETAGVRLRRLEDLKAGRALYMDFTNRVLAERGFEVAARDPDQAAECLVDLSQDYDLTLYEYFLTDRVGHRGSFHEAVSLLQELDRFLEAVVRGLDPASESLLITSDHGNIEDMTRTTHTLNQVPTLVWGPLRQHLAGSYPGDLSILNIAPAITGFLGVGPGSNVQSATFKR